MLNNLKIGTRLSGAFLALVVMLLGISYTGWSGISKMYAGTVDMYSDSLVPMRELGTVQYLSIRNRTLVMDMLINTDSENISKRIKEMGRTPRSLTRHGRTILPPVWLPKKWHW